MAYTFYKALGYEIGTSILDEKSVELAGDLLKKAEKAGVRMLIPVDVVCGKEFKNDTDTAVFKSSEMPQDMMGLDIGPATVELYKKKYSRLKQ